MALESFETGNGWLWLDSGIVGWLDRSSQFFGGGYREYNSNNYDYYYFYHMISTHQIPIPISIPIETVIDFA